MSENQDRNLIFDAYTYGIEPGGLRSKGDINAIICYAVAKSKVKLTKKNICDAMAEGGIANYFEVTEAFSRLLRDKIITEDENGYLSAPIKSEKLIEMVEKDLPLTIREKSVKIAMKLAEKEIFIKENKVDLVKTENGYDITMHITDKGVDFMVLKLNAPTEEQAILIKDKFVENPVKIYNNLIDSLFFE